MKLVTITRQVGSVISDEPGDKRSVNIKRADDGSCMIEWSCCDFTSGNVSVVTKVVLSERAAMATVLCLADLFQKLDEEVGL
jgi:hypothetical protein